MKKTFAYISLFSILLALLTSCGQNTETKQSASQDEESKSSVLVVRGGHPYDTPEFEEMCLDLEGIKSDLVLTAHFNQMKVAEIKENYDAILFLNQNKQYPEPERNRKKYMDLADEGVGMVFLHFTLSSQPEWDEYHDLVGGKWFLKSFTEDKSLHSTYFPDMTLEIKVLDSEHPVTEGLMDFTMTDTYYGNIYMSPSVHSLLGADNPDVSSTIAWTHQYKNSKVVYIMPGYSKKAFEHPSYRKLVSNALRFVGSK